MSRMADEVWRPLGFDGDDAVRDHALHNGIPDWVAASFWAWMRSAFTVALGDNISGTIYRFGKSILRTAERVIRFSTGWDGDVFEISSAMAAIRRSLPDDQAALRLADFLVSEGRGNLNDLDMILNESGSAWKLGIRAGKPGLVRRVPEGVQVQADAVIASAGHAGSRLTQAWEKAFGISPDPSGAYTLAVRAVEDAAVPSNPFTPAREACRARFPAGVVMTLTPLLTDREVAELLS